MASPAPGGSIHGGDGPSRSGDVLRPSATARSYTPAVDAPEPPGVASRTDPLTGMLLPREWNLILADEGARVRRYGRPATVVLIELDGLDRMTSILGVDAADRILPAVADSISRHARGADHVARLGTGRFGILLPETNEVEAVNFVERDPPGLRAVARIRGDRDAPGDRLGEPGRR